MEKISRGAVKRLIYIARGEGALNLFIVLFGLFKQIAKQAHSQKILLDNAFEEKVDLLILYPSPEEVKEFIIVWCMLIVDIHEGLCLYFFKSAFYLCVLVNLHCCLCRLLYIHGQAV